MVIYWTLLYFLASYILLHDPRKFEAYQNFHYLFTFLGPFRLFTFEKLCRHFLVSSKNITSIHLVLNIVQIIVISVGNNHSACFFKYF